MPQLHEKETLANMPEKTTQEKQSKIKQKRLSFLSKVKDLNWSDQARKVCKEKLEHYEATGNVKKADIYRRKLEI